MPHSLILLPPLLLFALGRLPALYRWRGFFRDTLFYSFRLVIMSSALSAGHAVCPRAPFSGSGRAAWRVLTRFLY